MITSTRQNLISLSIVVGLFAVLLQSCSGRSRPDEGVTAQAVRTSEEARTLVESIERDAIGICIQSHLADSFPADQDGGGLAIETQRYAALNIRRPPIGISADVDEATLIEVAHRNGDYTVYFEPTVRTLISIVGLGGCYSTDEVRVQTCPSDHCGSYSEYVLTRRE
ncbi:MAG: hypothetical protein ACK47M_02970 [Caldilinea sp.]